MAYTAPTEATIQFVGGTGTKAGKYQYNGGVTLAALLAGDVSDFMDANGGPTSDLACWSGDGNACTVTNSGGYVRISRANGFTNCVVGSLAYCYFYPVSSYDDGCYKVLEISEDFGWINISATYIDDDVCDVRVGGAIDTLQHALNNTVNNGTLYNRYIYTNLAESITASINQDVYGGSTTTKVYVIGYNATLTAESTVTITATVAIATGMLVWGASDYYEWGNIDFNGGGVGKANYCLYALTDGYGDYSTFKNCKFRSAVLDGIYVRSDYLTLVKCEASNNGRYGYSGTGFYQNYQVFCNTKFENNFNHGIYGRLYYSEVVNCIISNNGTGGSGYGIYEFGGVVKPFYMNNTIEDNPSGGIYFSSSDTEIVCFNNVCASTVGGINYDLNGTKVGQFAYFGYNLAAVGTAWDGGTDVAFEAFGDDHNIASSQTADELFETPGTDYTPETGSDLIGAGLPDAQGTATDIGAVEYEAGGGGGGIFVRPGVDTI